MTLLELQRRMEQDVRRPLTADFAMQESTAGGESMQQVAESYVLPGAALSAFERLEIYNRQYWFRVIDSVSEDYPALQAVLGQESFDALILAYLAEFPSTSWTLRDLSQHLPVFLARHPEYTSEQHSLAVDIARLEWAYIEAFDAAELTPIRMEDLQLLTPESPLHLQPHLRLLEVDYAVDDLLLEIKRSSEREASSGAALLDRTQSRHSIPEVPQEKRYLAVHRFEDVVYYRVLDQDSFHLLSAVQQGRTLAEAVQQTLALSQSSVEQQSIALRDCLAHAAEIGWLTTSTLQPPKPAPISN